MLRYAYQHEVSIIALENPGVLGYLKLVWLKSDERKREN
jgi:hypothetical protein